MTTKKIETIEVLPDPVSLIESMRAVGYSVEAAVADLVDNSIDAHATRITVQYDATHSPYLAILDDGDGMNSEELTNAMRHGSRNPADKRDAQDLGRFGLGLKTASLSQCRKLTVVSKKEGITSARCWDLDVVKATVKWVVVVPGNDVLEALPLYAQLELKESGTLVVWQDLDRLTAGSAHPQQEMTSKLSYLYDHLSLVFHRFTQGEGTYKAIEIWVNGLKVLPKDPFLKGNTFRQPLEGQVIRHERGSVQVTPYILPPVSNLSPEEIELAGGSEGLRNTQGFYVYRNRRLVIWGTWFRLVPKDEFYKLTRIQVDIPNTFDELWALDIKKSAAYPPDVIRNRLKELIPHFAGTSRKTITYPGRKQPVGKFIPLWIRVEPTRDSFKYELNVEHPAVAEFSSSMDQGSQVRFNALISLVDASLPLESIYADMCSDRRARVASTERSELVKIATSLVEVTGLSIDEVFAIDPLVRYPEHHESIRKEFGK